MSSKILASYKPAFFEMHVNAESKVFDFSNMDSINLHELTIFLHEYIHFLQDISTVWGINNIYVYGEFIKGAVERIKRESVNSFKIPVLIEDEEENINLNVKTVKATKGDDDDLNSFVITSYECAKYTIKNNGQEHEIPEIKITINHDGEEDILILGASAIQESMAYLVERLCSPSAYEKSPDYPYAAVEKMCDFIVPGFSEDKLKIVALSDMCLQFTNPGYALVKTMEKIKDSQVSFDTAEQVYDYFYSIKNSPLLAFEETGKFVDAAIGHLMGYMNADDPLLSEYYSWISKLFNFVKKWRIDDKYLLLDLIRSGNPNHNKKLKEILEAVGTPIIKGADGKYFKYQNQNGVNYIKIVSQLRDLFENSTIACTLCDCCPSYQCDLKCQEAPWNKTDSSHVCYYEKIWNHFGLNGYTPQIE